MHPREGETEKSWLRCNRFYILKDQWYFSTREGLDHGPFANKEEAQEKLGLYLLDQNSH